jgi:hypothetical protein
MRRLQPPSPTAFVPAVESALLLLLLMLPPLLFAPLQYMLGFVDDPEKPTDLLRHRFPSKVGGVPVSLQS